MTREITAFITKGGVPVTAPSPVPTITIKKLDGTPVLGPVNMTIVGDGGVKYTFADVSGTSYQAVVDADPTAIGQVTPAERYHYVSFTGGGSQFDVEQSWASALTPAPITFQGTIHLKEDGARVAIAGGATCSFQGYFQSGATIPGFSGNGTLRTSGSDTFFDCSATLVGALTPGQTIIVSATISGSGVGTGTHPDETAISVPEF